ncbi:MAG: hypothetical protein AMXMBFR64_10200 [Myxococcales bacterium]
MSRALLIAALLLALPARASLLDTYGFGARGTAMANASTAPSEDYEAVFYNPANLIARKEVHFGYGLNWVAPMLTIDRRQTDSTWESVVPEDNLVVHAGISVPWGGVFERKVSFGAALLLPLLRLTRVESIDWHVPQFSLYENVPDKLALLLGVAYEPIPELRLGVGVQILAELQGAARVSMSLLDNRVTSRDIRLDVFGAAAPTAGVTVLPVPELRIAASYRAALSLDYALPVQVVVEEIGNLDIVIRGVSLYTPHHLTLGVSYLTPVALTVSAELGWAMWSLAPSPAVDVHVTLDDSALVHGQAGGTVADLIRVDSPAVDMGARDILSPRVGLEWVANELVTVRGGYAFRPTPLPAPVHQTNFIDSPAHTTSLGASFTFADPLEHHRKPLTVGIALQWTLLEERAVDKPDPNDPVGDYTAGGSIFNLGIDFSHDF